MNRPLLPLCLLASLALAPAARAQCNPYSVQTSGGTIVAGTTDIGNHADDLVTPITLPFPVSLYGASYTTAYASSNGNLQFAGPGSNSYSNNCLPDPTMGPMLAPHWDDLMTTSGGIFTSITGSQPNRIFNIEWRAGYYPNTAVTLNFEIRLYENNTRIDFVYGAVPNAGSSATVGIQPATGTPLQFTCNAGGLSQGLVVVFTPNNNSNVLCGVGAANPATVTNCGGQTSTLVTVQAIPAANPPSTGIVAIADLSSIGGSSTQPLFDDGTHGDATAGDNVFSFRAPVPSSLTPGGKVINYSLYDQQGRNGSGTITLAVTACPTRGPDVWVSDLIDVSYYGAVGGVNAYAVGTNACNLGDLPVGWYSGVNRHPVIAQNMFRLKNGRFEQIGQSWLKHGFASTNGNSCGTCISPPDGGSQLGVACSDAYGSGLNGSQGDLGPRSQVNATTGVYPYPPANPTYDPTIGRRLQVHTADADPALNAGALYFVECHYVTADDAQFNNGTLPGSNGLNNSTYRAITMSSGGANPNFSGNSVVRVPPLQAWRDNDPSVQISTADYIDQSLGAPGIIGRFWVASKATSNGNGTWHYEYAVYNHNADRAGGSFSIPIAAGTSVTNIAFHGVFAHSGEPYPNTATSEDNWLGTLMNGAIVWTCPEAYAPPNGDNGNALRWGTMYNFRFDANVAPSADGAAATIGLYKPASASNPATSASAAAIAPGAPCGSADFNHDGNSGTDADIEAFFACLAGNCCPTCGSADFNGDGDVATDADIEAFFRVLAGGTC